MTTISQLIKRSLHNPVRRAYIKRRLSSDASYEASWQRIDFFDGQNRVIDWGSVSIEIDHEPGVISQFNSSSLNIIFDNQGGHWNVETDVQSIWFDDASTYLNRKFSKLKVECGYKDEDGTEVGVVDVFEGVIESVRIGENQKSVVNVLSYQTILQRYSVSDLSMTGAKTVSTIVDLIMNQSKITDFIPFVAAVPTTDQTIQDSALLEGTYWEILQNLAYWSNSVIKLVGDTFAFKARTAGVSSVWDFEGIGTTNPDIFQVLSYEDEGADRVRLFFKAKDQSESVTSSDTVLLQKYLGEPEIIDLDNFNSVGRTAILTSLLSTWENPKPVIRFSTRFMLNQLEPLDKINLTIFGQLLPVDNSFRWDAWTWDDGSVWGQLKGAVNIKRQDFMVTQVNKNIQNWSTEIKAEKV